MDGQIERMNQVLDDMLRSCVIDFESSWETHLHLIEFAYNNSQHSSIGVAPFEELYGRPCRSPLCWGEVGDVGKATYGVSAQRKEQVPFKISCKIGSTSRLNYKQSVRNLN